MTAEDDFHDLLDQLNQLGAGQDQESAAESVNDGLTRLFLRLGPPPNDGQPDDDPHAGCWQPHHGADGYTDRDGQPL